MRSRALSSAVVLASIAAVVLPAGAWGGASAARTHTVTLKNTSFHPGTLSISRGESVTWVWRDEGLEHNVTAHSFHSGTKGSGSFTVRFTRKGTFSYRCTIHAAEGMRGRIVVH